MSELDMVRMIRPTCSDCGKLGLLYGRVTDLMPRVSEDQRKSFAKGMEWFGGSGPANPYAWVCLACGGLGIFGDFEMG